MLDLPHHPYRIRKPQLLQQLTRLLLLHPKHFHESLLILLNRAERVIRVERVSKICPDAVESLHRRGLLDVPIRRNGHGLFISSPQKLRGGDEIPLSIRQSRQFEGGDDLSVTSCRATLPGVLNSILGSRVEAGQGLEVVDRMVGIGAGRRCCRIGDAEVGVQTAVPADQRCLEDGLVVGAVVAGRQETLGVFESIIVGTGANLRIWRDVLAAFADLRWRASKEVSSADLERVEC